MNCSTVRNAATVEATATCSEQLSASTQVEHFLNNDVFAPLFTVLHIAVIGTTTPLELQNR